jgi:hypothetical protein
MSKRQESLLKNSPAVFALGLPGHDRARPRLCIGSIAGFIACYREPGNNERRCRY